MGGCGTVVEWGDSEGWHSLLQPEIATGFHLFLSQVTGKVESPLKWGKITREEKEISG